MCPTGVGRAAGRVALGTPPAAGLAATGTMVARDACVVAVATLVAFVLAGHIDVAERYLDWAAGHEHWQADEVPFTLLCLCGGVLWFAWRRACEARELRCRVQALSRHLLAVQEEERRHLARELHDELGQHCAAIRFEAQCLQRALAAGRAPAGAASPGDDVSARAGEPCSAGRLDASVAAIGSSATALHAELRRLLTRLRPAALDTLGLEAALDDLVANWQRTYGVAVERRIGALGTLPDGLAIGVFRVVQEALTNVARHAQAHCVVLQVVRDRESVAVDIRDDGRGFPAGGAPGGFGLTGMAERVAGLGGLLEIGEAAAGGVHIAVRIPVDGEAPGGECP